MCSRSLINNNLKLFLWDSKGVTLECPTLVLLTLMKGVVEGEGEEANYFQISCGGDAINLYYQNLG